MTQNHETLEAALMYAELGWRIIPCKALDKSPHIKEWPSRATSSAEQIRRWWKKWPNALIGVLTGDAGRIVLDVDEKNGKHGEATLAGHVQKYGPLPETMEHRTPSLGRQVWFCLPEGQHLRTGVCALGDGLDVKADAGYVIVPPSVMVDGRTYEWINSPLTHEPALAPTWIAAELHANTQPQKRGERKPIGDDGLAAREPAKLARALLAIPNEERSYDDWITALHAYKAAVRGDEEFYEPFEEWSSCYPENTCEVIREKWESVSDSSIGAEYIYRLARKHGFDEAPEDFVGSNDQWRVREKRPTIRHVGGELDQVVAKAEATLVAAEDGIYCYGTSLSRPKVIDIKASDGRETKGVRVISLDDAYLRERLTAAVRFKKYDARSKSYEDINCPVEIAQTILSHREWKFPELTGFTNVPMLRPDGTVLDKPGFDAATGMLFDPGSAVYTISDNPSRADALKAVETLAEPLSGMPYVDDVDRSVAITAILSGFSRRSVTLLPLFAFSAKAAGSGKSLHADIISEMVEGHPAEAIPPGEQREELGKQLATALMRGSPIVSLDNLVDPLGKMPLIHSVLSQENVPLRILGQSKDVIVPGHRLLLVNGNNLVILADLVRRTLICHLDAQCEDPENRYFTFHPVRLIRENRERFVTAALTILRAFERAERPQPPWGEEPGKVAPMGGFEEWDARVRAAVMWLGLPDPCGSTRALKVADPERSATLHALRAWDGVFGAWDGVSKPAPVVTSRMLFNGLADNKGDGVIPSTEQVELREALEEAMPSNKKFTARAIGEWLSSIEGAYRCGYVVRKGPGDTVAKVAGWILVKTSA